MAGYADNFRKDGVLNETRLSICPDTFTKRSLAEAIKDINARPVDKTDLGQMWSFAHNVLHEMMHLDSIGKEVHSEYLRDTSWSQDC